MSIFDGAAPRGKHGHSNRNHSREEKQEHWQQAKVLDESLRGYCPDRTTPATHAHLTPAWFWPLGPGWHQREDVWLGFDLGILGTAQCCRQLFHDLVRYLLE